MEENVSAKEIIETTAKSINCSATTQSFPLYS